MENKGLNEFKEILRQGMIKNFEIAGFITPVLFFYMENNPIISVIPPEVLSTESGKNQLATIIRGFCDSNPVLAAGIIIEADAAKIHKDNEELRKALDGEMKVADLKEKQDIIVMIFSTPEKEEMISYVVDIENKKVLEPFSDDSPDSFSGRFTHFFSWRKN